MSLALSPTFGAPEDPPDHDAEKHVSLLERTHALFEKIAASRSELGEDHFRSVLAQVTAQGGTEDGLSLVERFYNEQTDIDWVVGCIISGNAFIKRHRALSKALAAELEREVYKHIGEPHSEWKLNFIKYASDFQGKSDTKREQQITPTPLYKTIEAEITDHYAEYLAARTFKMPERPEKDPLEAVVEEHLEKVWRALKGCYYSTGARSKILAELNRVLPPGDERDGLQKKFENDFPKGGFTRPRDSFSPAIRTLLEPARYRLTQPLYDLERQGVTDSLKTALTESLGERGTVHFSDARNQWEVRLNETKLKGYEEVSLGRLDIKNREDYELIQSESNGRHFFYRPGPDDFIDDQNKTHFSLPITKMGGPFYVDDELYIRIAIGRSKGIFEAVNNARNLLTIQNNAIGSSANDIKPFISEGELYLDVYNGKRRTVVHKDHGEILQNDETLIERCEVNGVHYLLVEYGAFRSIMDVKRRVQLTSNLNSIGLGSLGPQCPAMKNIDGKLYVIGKKDGVPTICDMEGNSWESTKNSDLTVIDFTVMNNSIPILLVEDKHGRRMLTDHIRYFPVVWSEDKPQMPKCIGGELFFVSGSVNAQTLNVYRNGKSIPIHGEFNQVWDYYEVNGRLLVICNLDAYELVIKKYPLHPEKALSDKEEKLLADLNLVHDPKLEAIERRLQHSQDECDCPEKHVNGDLYACANPRKGDAGVADMLTRMAQTKECAKALLNTMAAKRDQNIPELAERLAKLLIPESARLKKEEPAQAPSDGNNEGEGIGAGPGRFMSPVSPLLENRHSLMLRGAAEDERNTLEVMNVTPACRELMLTGIFGGHDSKTNEWRKVEFEVEADARYPRETHDVTLADVRGMQETVLPKTISGNVRTGSCVGILSDGSSVDLEVRHNALREAVADLYGDIESVQFTMEVPAKHDGLTEISDQEHDRSKRSFERVYGKALSEPIKGLTQDMEIFLREIAHLAPRQKVLAIKRFVKDIGYYDPQNGDVAASKIGQPLSKKLYLMQQRLIDLRAKDPTLDRKLGHKKYAGVCADFAELEAALLKKAGFLAGVATGFLSGDELVLAKASHAVGFVVWPGEKGYRVVPVDSTPNGSVGQMDYELVTIQSGPAETPAAPLAHQEPEEQSFLEEVDVKRLMPEQVKKLMEKIAKMKLDLPNVALIGELLEVFWYTPLNALDLQKPEDRAQIGQAFSPIVQRHHEANKPEPMAGLRGKIQQIVTDLSPAHRRETRSKAATAGGQLIDVLQSFVKRFQMEQKGDTAVAVNFLEAIVSCAAPELSATEKKATQLILASLRN